MSSAQQWITGLRPQRCRMMRRSGITSAHHVPSLVAVHVKNRMQKETGLSIPLVNALRGGSVASLVDDVMVRHQEIAL